MLSTKMRDFGGSPRRSPASDFKGFSFTGFTALRSLTGTKGALEAMETNERLTTSKYEKASACESPGDIAVIIRADLADEQRHLSFIREALAGRS